MLCPMASELTPEWDLKSIRTLGGTIHQFSLNGLKSVKSVGAEG